MATTRIDAVDLDRVWVLKEREDKRFVMNCDERSMTTFDTQ